MLELFRPAIDAACKEYAVSCVLHDVINLKLASAYARLAPAACCLESVFAPNLHVHVFGMLNQRDIIVQSS